MALRRAMARLLQEPAPEDPNEMRRLLGRIDEALQRSRFGLSRANESSTVFELIPLRRKLRTRRIMLLERLKQMDFGMR